MPQSTDRADTEILPPLPAPSAWQHAPHDDPAEDDARGVFRSDLPPDLQFDPVPRRAARSNGFTAERQRAFVQALAAGGSVRLACKAIQCSSHAMYKLRNAAGAESFSAAWDNAVRRGARRVLDVMIDNAVNGTPEYLYQNGQLIAERRRFNTRGQMWLVAHYMPDQFAVEGGLMHHPGSAAQQKRLKEQWRREWYAEHSANQRKTRDDAQESYSGKVNTIRAAFKRSIAEDPVRRAAWEILTGPTDWDDTSKVPQYDNLPEVNHNRPDMIVLQAALNVDTPDFGLMKAAEAGELGPELQAEAERVRRARLREGA
jgi:hypothetical protein